MFDTDHLVNPQLLKMVKQASPTLGGFGKLAFVPGGDPSMGGGAGGDPSGGGGAPPGGDPMGGGGGAPPGGGGDAGGGAPPSDPRIDQLMSQMQQMQMMMQQGGGGGAAGSGAGGLKPKIDVNVEIMQMKNLMAKIVDHLGIPVPAQDMTATPDKLNAMAAGQSTSTPGGGGAGGGAGGGGAIGGIPPMDPMQGAGVPGQDKAGSYKGNGSAFDTTALGDNFNKAAAIMALRKKAKATSE